MPRIKLSEQYHDEREELYTPFYISNADSLSRHLLM